MMTSDTRIAILILNYNGEDFLDGCIRSIYKQDYTNYTIFLIDNNSNDNSILKVKKTFPEVKIIKNSINYGFAQGMNKGIQQVINDYKYIMLLDNDIIAEKKMLSSLVKVISNDKKVGICSSTVVDWHGETIQSMGGYFFNFLTGTNIGYAYGKNINNFRDKEPFEVFYASGGAMLVKSNVLKEIGYFDKTFFVYYEEIDLAWRAHLYGYKVLNCPQSIVRHFGSGTNSKQKYIASFHAEKNRLLIYFKNLSIISFILIFPVLLSSRILIYCMIFIIRKDMLLLKSHFRAIKYFIFNFTKYVKDRKAIQRRRVISDRTLLRKPFFQYKFSRLV